MKIQVNRKPFSDTLAEVMPFINKKAPIEILKNAKITTKGNRLKIEANDQQSGIVKYMEVIESDQDGSFLIPMDDFTKFFSKLDCDTVEIFSEGDRLEVRHPKGVAEFSAVPEKEYPSFKMREGEEETEISVPTDALKDFISKGKNFVSQEPIRPIMTAMYAYLKDGQFGFCASDTHVLITGSIDFPSEKEISFFIMPGAFSALSKACSQGDLAHIKFNQSQVQYRIGNTIIQTLQVKGNYPNFNRVIPQDNPIECGVDKNDIMKTLQRVCMFCSEASMCVKFNFSRMDLTVSADDLDYGKKSSESVAHNGCNSEITIGLQGEFFQKCLGVFSNGEIILKMSDPARPVLLTQQGCNLRVIQMPMQIL